MTNSWSLLRNAGSGSDERSRPGFGLVHTALGSSYAVPKSAAMPDVPAIQIPGRIDRGMTAGFETESESRRERKLTARGPIAF